MTAHCKPDPTEYAPYHHYAEFWQGVADYPDTFPNRYWHLSTEGDAYDRGAQYAMRLARWVDSKEVVR